MNPCTPTKLKIIGPVFFLLFFIKQFRLYCAIFGKVTVNSEYVRNLTEFPTKFAPQNG